MITIELTGRWYFSIEREGVLSTATRQDDIDTDNNKDDNNDGSAIQTGRSASFKSHKAS